MVFILNIEPLKVVLNQGEDENKSIFSGIFSVPAEQLAFILFF